MHGAAGMSPGGFFLSSQRFRNDSIVSRILLLMTAEEYQRRAEESERMAQDARDLEAKRIFLEAAKNWRELAVLAAQNKYLFRP